MNRYSENCGTSLKVLIFEEGRKGVGEEKEFREIMAENLVKDIHEQIQKSQLVLKRINIGKITLRIIKIKLLQNVKNRGVWVAQLIKLLPLAQVLIPGSMD